MRIFAGFDDNLRQAFRRETELFLGDIFRQDRSVLDLLSAKYTYLNERLAKTLWHSECLRRTLSPRGPGRKFAPRRVAAAG